MNRFLIAARWSRLHYFVLAGAVVVGLAALPASAAAAACGSGPGSCGQADIDASIEKALTYFDANQNPDGSWGTTDAGAETALVLGAYGVKGYANLTPAQQTRVQNGMNWLLGTQCVGTTPPATCTGSDGSFDNDSLNTYDTGTALIALSLLGDVPTTQAGAIPTATTDARNYLIANQEITANGVATPCTSGGTDLQGGSFCGGWDYTQAAGDQRSDESNTGFALTGLDLTGGVPADVAANNVGWQRDVQQLTSNPGGFTSRNDGGGAYEPGISTGDFSSNANDNGSLTFGYAYDGVPASDPGAAAAIKIANDTFDVYETPGSKADRVMVFHTGMNEDGACDPKIAGCDWSEATGEGGYHYSIFALVKGLSQYITPSLTDPTNFYAKAVDLLLGEQNADGSWPADLRDDGSVLGATAFAVLALGRVGAPADEPISAQGTSLSDLTEGKSFNGTVATFTDPDKSASPTEYSASIDWGDGSTSTGTITGTGGNFTVNGTHTYNEQGSYTVKVTITDVDTPANSAAATSSAKVADAALHAVGAQPSKSGLKVNGSLATFTDDNPNAKTTDYTVTITWGDGKQSSGAVKQGTGHFIVTGSHAYKSAGTYRITVKIVDDGGSAAIVTDTVSFVVHGTAKLRGVPAACVASPVTLQVVGRRIASVTWSVNGARISGKKIHARTRYSARIASSSGAHRVTAVVRFVTASHTHARTLHATVVGCPVPTFTG